MTRPAHWTTSQIREAEQQAAAANRNAGMSPRQAHVEAARTVSRRIENDQNTLAR